MRAREGWMARAMCAQRVRAARGGCGRTADAGRTADEWGMGAVAARTHRAEHKKRGCLTAASFFVSAQTLVSAF